MRILTFLVISLMAFSINAQDNTPYDFLTVVIDNPEVGKGLDKVFYYPEGSHYKVYLQKKNAEPQEQEGVVTYYGDMKLRVYPQYRKQTPDDINVQDKRIRIFTTAKAAYSAGFASEWNEATYDNNSSGPGNYGFNNNTDVTLDKELIPSETLKGKYNLKLTFSNGITFTYTDGEYEAFLDRQKLEVKSKYIIESKLGTTKFSFNENNGEVWWIFEPKED